MCIGFSAFSKGISLKKNCVGDSILNTKHLSSSRHGQLNLCVVCMLIKKILIYLCFMCLSILTACVQVHQVHECP